MPGNRVERALELLEELNLDAIVLLNLSYPQVDLNFIYLLQPETGLFEGSYLVLSKKRAVLYTYRLEEPAAKRMDAVRKGAVEVEVIEKPEQVFKSLRKFRRIGMNLKFTPADITARVREMGVAIVDVSEDFDEMRIIKDSSEVEAIQNAARAAEKALSVVYTVDVEEASEKDLRAEIEYRMLKEGCEPAFQTIVAYDENASIPHYTTGSRDKKPEKLVLIDLGAKCRWYVSDITRTFLLARDKELEDVYTAVLEAQLKAIDAIKPGVKAEEPDKRAKETLKARGYPPYPHSLGHMIGLNVHEGKRLKEGEDYKLKEGMVFTVEPGVYISEKLGVRIEDDIAVEEHGAKLLTSFKKELDDIVLV